MYRFFIRPFLFLFPAETAHHLALRLLSIQIRILKIFGLINLIYPVIEDKQISAFGLKFKNQLGLAAGFDKDAKYLDILQYLGFGFLEVGTITPKAQAGNPKPRLFRLKQDNAIINRMGFNNGGVHQMVDNLKKFKNERNLIIGGNIGKNKTTPNEDAINDYVYCFEQLHDYVDYFVVNVSSPNTPGLRALQDKEPLLKILSKLVSINIDQKFPKPILLKIAPDVTEGQLDDIADIALNSGIHGMIISNTTIDRSNLKTDKMTIESIGNGGLSGVPLHSKAMSIQKAFLEKTNGKVEIIAVGGINDAVSAINTLSQGAKLVQVYTGFVYGGVPMLKSITKELP